MGKNKLSKLDLNLLVVLNELIKTKSVTEAGNNVGLSQSATSRALSRLRDFFNDDLLVRNGKQFELTRRAQVLAPKILDTLLSIDKIISPSEFNPSKAEFEFKIFGVEVEIISFLPKLFSKLKKEAPNISLSISSGTLNHFELLQKGEVHFVMSGLDMDRNISGIKRVAIGESKNVCMMRKAHPLAKEDLSLKKYISCDHGIINLTGKGLSSTDIELKKRGLQRKVSLKAPSFTSAAYFCEKEDILFLIPENMAKELCKKHRLIMKSPPKELIESTTFYLYWHERFDNELQSKWFRDVIGGL